jgi:hypothetical protein
MAPREIESIYTGLRDQALSFGSVEIKAAPVVPGGQALGVVMDMGYETAVVSVVGLADGTTSMYISNGGGMIGVGESSDAAAASKRWVEVAEAALASLSEGGDDRLPEDGTIGFNVLTTGPRFSGEAAESELAGGSHPLSALYAAGQDVIAEIRAVDEARQAADA